ncbi:protein fem-1 homolog A-like [Macrobrachium nipponense]|uniref:protein fem-1 homolog A-like n=1 Tax=Macrobrachium nipponense TaxID=159736 RepID=UPI0030C812DB
MARGATWSQEAVGSVQAAMPHARATGHLEVVDFLLSKGANANGVTTFNSTPLAAACSHGHFEVAKLLLEHGAYTEAVDHQGDNCLMLASCSGHLDIVKYLLNIGVDVNRRNIYGKSALYGSVESGNLEVMKVLLSYNATLEADYSGTTPLMAASSRGHANIVEYLVSRTDISRMEKIEALELLGASVLDKIRDAVGAVEYWKSALSLRYVDGALMYPKPDHHLSCPLCDEFGEFTTVQQLEAIENNNNAVYLQSLLVRERILGTDDAGTMRSFRSTGLDYARCGDLKWCINLWLHAISMQQLQLKPLDPSRLFHLQSFVSLFAIVMNSNHTRKWNYKPAIYFEDLMCAFEVCTEEMAMVTYSILNETCICERKNHDSHLDQVIAVVMHLLVSLTRLQTDFWASQWCEVKMAVSRLVNMDPRDSTGSTLLHLACSLGVRDIGNLLLPISDSLRTEIVDLLLETGSDPCARDHAGNTPFHVLAWNEDVSENTVGALLSAGANLDDVNSRGETFGSLMASREQPLGQFEDTVSHSFVQCLAAE